jgi:hypothetical protein
MHYMYGPKTPYRANFALGLPLMCVRSCLRVGGAVDHTWRCLLGAFRTLCLLERRLHNRRHAAGAIAWHYSVW